MIALAGWCAMAAHAVAQTPKKTLPFLVGVSKYQKDRLDDLKYAQQNARDLTDVSFDHQDETLANNE